MRSRTHSSSGLPFHRCGGGNRDDEGAVDFKCDTSVENDTTTLLSYHFTQRVEGEDTGHEGGGHRTYAVIEAIMPEELVRCRLVVLLYVTEEMSDHTDLRNV